MDEKSEDFETKEGTIWRRQPKRLGEGGYSQVYLYKNASGSKCAVKRIANLSGGGRTTLAEIEREKTALIKFSDHERFRSIHGMVHA